MVGFKVDHIPTNIIHTVLIAADRTRTRQLQCVYMHLLRFVLWNLKCMHALASLRNYCLLCISEKDTVLLIIIAHSFSKESITSY